MLGAIAGDIIGSRFEYRGIKTTEFDLFHPDCEFTDDSVLTIAVADSILNGTPFVDSLMDYYHRYPKAGYGSRFIKWADSGSRQPYHSYGNGSAMRVSAIGFAYDQLDEVMKQARASAIATHNHPEGIKGAQATAVAVFLARTGKPMKTIQSVIESHFGYNLSETLDSIRPHYRYDITCQGTVPQAIRAFLESVSFEDVVRKAVSLGGDSDTLACITGGIAHAFYKKLPKSIVTRVFDHLDPPLGTLSRKFCKQYNCL